MKVAIDVDGTLTRHPRELGELMRSLTGAGHRVVVLTGCACPEPQAADVEGLVGQRARQLDALGITAAHRDGIEVCVGRSSAEVSLKKALWLSDSGADVFIDDNEAYCREARRLRPGLVILKVFP